VSILTLNAPEKRNAISAEMREAAIFTLKACIASDECRAIVLTGNNGDFCSGGDVKATEPDAEPDPLRTRRNSMLLHDVVRLIAVGPKAVVAAVEGCAYGAGVSLAAACDHIVAGQGARFCASFGKVGLMADAGLTWSLVQRVGPVKAKQLLLTARVVETDEALKIGLIDQLVDRGGALEAAIAEAETYASLAPLAVAAMKSALGRGPAPLETMLAIEADLQPMLAMSRDYREGREAFTQRRKPSFRGR
jgi:enoyl-CoA hydratase/carnithine racemase